MRGVSPPGEQKQKISVRDWIHTLALVSIAASAVMFAIVATIYLIATFMTVSIVIAVSSVGALVINAVGVALTLLVEVAL